MATKQEILDAAVVLFAGKGTAFSMTELADAVGIRAPSLYSHFPSKEEILGALVRREVASCRQALSEAVAQLQGSCRENAAQTFRFLLDYFSCGERLRFWKNMMLLEDDKLRTGCLAELIAQNSWLTQQLERWLQQGAEAGELSRAPDKDAVEAYYAILLGALDNLLLRQGTDFDAEAYGGRLFAAWWRSVGGEPQ